MRSKPIRLGLSFAISLTSFLPFHLSTLLAHEVLEEIESSQQEANMRGFLEWILSQEKLQTESEDLYQDAHRALVVLAAESSKLSGYTNLNDPSDATSLENMIEACKTLQRTNELRALESQQEQTEIPPLQVSLELVAIAQKHLNWSDTNLDHARMYAVWENLAWGQEDPAASWYFHERDLAKEGVSEGIGHYQNVVNAQYQSTGAAHNTNNPAYGQGQCDGQVFLFSPGYLSVERYIDLVQEYAKLFNQAQDRPDPKPLDPQVPSEDLRDDPSDLDPIIPGNSTPSDSKPAPIWTLDEIPEDYEPLWRFYNCDTGEHFYTVKAAERQALIEMPQWLAEGIGWMAPKTSSVPVYRVYNPNMDDHHYTLNQEERDTLVRLGWDDEGIGWYSDPDEIAPVYRQYNPNATSGCHNYTVSTSEKQALIGMGWLDENIGWFASALPKTSDDDA